jgi:hypothetical protein
VQFAYEFCEYMLYLNAILHVFHVVDLGKALIASDLSCSVAPVCFLSILARFDVSLLQHTTRKKFAGPNTQMCQNMNALAQSARSLAAGATALQLLYISSMFRIIKHFWSSGISSCAIEKQPAAHDEFCKLTFKESLSRL